MSAAFLIGITAASVVGTMLLFLLIDVLSLLRARRVDKDETGNGAR
jgi:hypothetical protein